MHDLKAHPPRTTTERWLDLGAALIGVAMPLGGHFVGHHGAELEPASELARQLGQSFVKLTLDTAPLLLVGLFAGALIQSFGSKIPDDWLRSRGPTLDAVRGAVVGAPLPLCSCSVLPVSGALAKRATPALVVAFLISTPELGVETFALGVRFLGWEFAALRLAGALAVAIVAGIVVGRLASDRAPVSAGTAGAIAASPPDAGGGAVRRTLRAFDELLHHIGAWMVIGLVAAAAVEALIPAAAFSAIEHPLLELAVVTLVAVPSYVCAPAATPLAAVLIAKGLSPGAVLVGLLLGPATNLATQAFLKSTFGTRATLASIAAVISLSWALALGTNALLPAIEVHAHGVVAHEAHGALAIGAAIVFALLLARSVWMAGARAWLGSMGDMGHGHGHGHGHGPAGVKPAGHGG
jgi:uncharacterized membrane protein YraQ (UPF0718 family)